MVLQVSDSIQAEDQANGYTYGQLAYAAAQMPQEDLDLDNLVQIGIQTIPGLKFYITGGINTDPMVTDTGKCPLWVGPLGIFNLEVKDTECFKIIIPNTSLELLKGIQGSYLIIDYIKNKE